MGNGVDDIWLPRLVVCFLGVVSTAGIMGAFILSWERQDVPPSIVAVTSVAVTCLVNSVNTVIGGRRAGDNIPPRV